MCNQGLFRNTVNNVRKVVNLFSILTVNHIRKRAENCQPKTGKDISLLHLLQCCSQKKGYEKVKNKLYIYIYKYRSNFQGMGIAFENCNTATPQQMPCKVQSQSLEINFLVILFVNRNAIAVPLQCQTKEKYSSPVRREKSLTGEFFLPDLTAKNRFRELERKLFTNKQKMQNYAKS